MVPNKTTAKKNLDLFQSDFPVCPRAEDESLEIRGRKDATSGRNKRMSCKDKMAAILQILQVIAQCRGELQFSL